MHCCKELKESKRVVVSIEEEMVIIRIDAGVFARKEVAIKVDDAANFYVFFF